METNPYEYDRTVPWIPQQNQRPVGAQFIAPSPQVGAQFIAPSRAPKPKSPERMPKARALALARTLKKWLVIASFVSFGTLSGLVAFHQVGTTTSHTTQSSSKSSQAATATPSSSNGFFNQQGGNNIGSSNSSQGSTSGSSNSSQGSTSGSSNSSQTPVSGSGVS